MSTHDGIAIIGLSGRFPRAKTIAEFWTNLMAGVETISFFDDAELRAAGIAKEIVADPNYVKAKGMLDDVEWFDAAFFGITPKEAEIMDPQQRLFLECAWTALEDAGYDTEQFSGPVGLYAGAGINSYLMLNLFSNRGVIDFAGILQSSIPNRTDHLTTRCAYKLNLKGPAITVQTACSTSLVAVHLACQSLLNYQCDIALAGGVTITAPQKSGYYFQEGGVLSPDGHCRPFDHKANGTVAGNGVGVVVLKRLADALADGDEIHAVIKGSAINNDGSLKVGYTAPSVEGQVEVIAMAQALAGITPDTISYIEAHGTGTTLGDPIEIAALTEVFRAGTSRKNFCAIGAVKANIGHLDVAAGVAGLIKTTLALKHRVLPPAINFETANPGIDLAGSPFYVSNRPVEWKNGSVPRRAGVSSFGIGGTNAHVVLEEAPPRSEPGPSRPSQLLVVSAKSAPALETATTNLSAYLKENPNANLADVAYTLAVGRRPFRHRRMLVARDAEDAAQALDALDPRRVITGLQEPKERPVMFMFPGQGAQYVGMGRGLYELEPTFRAEVDRCAEQLKPLLGLDVRDVMYPPAEHVQQSEEQLRQTAITQPALFVIEYALAKLLIQWGVRPAGMIGHSLGEFVAACLAGVLSLNDALTLVAVRGRLMQSVERGAMLSVPLPEQDVRAMLGAGLSLASVNAPSLCVVSGPTGAIAALEQKLKAKDVLCRRLHTSHAFHSPMMEPILDAFRAEVEKVDLNKPNIPFVSNLSGTWIKAAEAADPEYWVRHLRQTVRFGDGVTRLFEEPDSVLLEVGPGTTMMTIARWHPAKAAGQAVLTSLPRSDESDADLISLQNSLGRLWMAGVKISWSSYFGAEQRRRVSLPTYPFERRRYWIEPGQQTAGAVSAGQSLRKKENLTDWFYIPSWKSSAAPARFESLTVTKENESWVLFADDCGLAQRLAAKLGQAGADVTMVLAGEQFAARGERDFTVTPQRREDFEALVQALVERGKWPARLVHLWNVTPEFDSLADRDLAAKCQQEGFYSLLSLAQALGSKSDPVELTVVTNEMQAVTGDETLCPEKATVLGPCRVVPQEYKHLKCRSLDVRLPYDDNARDKLAELLAVELLCDSQEKTVAYRHQQRWIRSFEPYALQKTGQTGARLREKGVYLITGGLGGMGLVFAEQLARVAGARLALVGRSAFPARDRWRRWLGTHSEHDEVSEKIRRLQELEKYGARVEVFSADVADFDQMKSVLERVVEQFGPVNGVIHTAGVPGGGMIPLKTTEKASAILAPKVEGTRVLGQLFQNTPLDFLFLCSSRSSILGGFGQIDYCAANAFLDAFSHYYSAKTGTFTVAVDWDGWQEVGMLVNTAAQYGVNPGVTAKQKLDHPLLAQVTHTADRATYLTQFSVAQSWILEEHRIGGRAVLPGVTYLEMARAAFEQHEGNGVPIELRDVFFVTPMSIDDDEKRDVRLVLERNGDGFKFRASSKPSSGGGAAARWQDHAIGEIGRAPARASRQHDLNEIIRHCEKELFISESERDPDLGPRWQNIQKVYLGEREILVLFELGEAFAPDLERLKLHPSLLDRAAGTGMLFLKLEGIYLPMSYKRLRVEQPLPRRIYAHIRETENNYSRKETITFDVLIMDENGNELVEIEEFAEKRINDLTEQVRLTSDKRVTLEVEDEDEGQVGRGKSFYEESIREGMSPSEGVEVFTRILARATVPQVIVSTKDLAASMLEAEAFIEDKISQEIEKLPAARTLHPRPDVQTDYVAPRNELEELLAGIMQEALGVDRVGIDDNFFELGGDSVLSIQIIARVNRAGWQITPQQIFQHQTIAELAAVAVKSSTATGTDDQPVAKETTPAPAFNLTGLEGRKLNKLSRLLEEEDGDEEEFADEEVATVEEPISEVVQVNRNGSYAAPSEPHSERVARKKIDFSLFYFAADNSQSGADKYRLYLEGAKFADRNGFAAVWTPERHFHESGGLYPNPSVLSAALATITERVKLRAGSVVLPLHHSMRVAEEWSIVDNLSAGRVGLSFTSGWIPNDFAFFPERFANKREEMLRGIDEVQRLWRGETIAAIDGAGKSRDLRILPRPLQPELPIWLTCSGDPQVFVRAGELGLNVLTALLSQSVEEVAGKIELYREARASRGHDPEAGSVSLMVHTFVGNDEQKVLDLTRGPLTDYLKAHVGLIETMTQSLDIKVDIDKEKYLDYLVAFAFERYYQTASLIGTPNKCLPLVNRLADIGVDELACFIDFGVDVSAVLDGLHHLNQLKQLCETVVEHPPLAQAAHMKA